MLRTPVCDRSAHRRRNEGICERSCAASASVQKAQFRRARTDRDARHWRARGRESEGANFGSRGPGRSGANRACGCGVPEVAGS